MPLNHTGSQPVILLILYVMPKATLETQELARRKKGNASAIHCIHAFTSDHISNFRIAESARYVEKYFIIPL